MSTYAPLQLFPTTSPTSLFPSIPPSIGPTGLSGLAGQLPGLGQLPYARGVGGLMSGPAGAQLPRAFTSAADISMGTLRPLATSTAPMAAETSLGAQMGNAAGGLFRPAAGMTRLGMASRGLGYGLAGQLGSSLIDQLDIGGQNSNWEQAAQGAAQGAGIGAGIGSIIPGVGTGVGAAIGAVGGGALGILTNMFGGGGEEGEEAKPLDVLATAMTSANLSPDHTEEILTTYETLMALAEQQPEGDERDAARQQAFDAASAMILQAMQAKEQAPVDAANTLALQHQAMQVFQPIADDIRSSSALYAQAMGGIRDSLPESYRGVADATVARELTSADKLANAYMAQAALTPIADRLTQYQQQQDAFAQQLFSQAMAQQVAAMNSGGMGLGGLGAGGGGDLASQLIPQS